MKASAPHRIRLRTFRFDHRKGSALVTVLILAAAMLASAAVVLAISQRTATFSAALRRDACSLYDAEAGVSIMLDLMSANQQSWAYWSAGRTLVTNYDGAMLTVTTSTTTNRDTGVRTTRITSTARRGQSEQTTIVETRYVPIQFYQVLAGGNIDLDSGAFDIYGDIHANGNIDGGGGTVYGNITCSGPSCTQPAAPGYTASANEPRVDMNRYDCRPFDNWLSMAQNGGIYYPSSVEFNNDILKPGNGVVYVNGDITMKRGCVVTGVVVAAGSIDISQRFEQHAPPGSPPSWWVEAYGSVYGSNWPSLLAGATITERNNNEWTYPGCVFAAGGITMTQRRRFLGSVISLTNVYVKNNVLISNQGQVMTNAIDLDMGAWLK